jgi:DNA-binding NarL/FixJ family response regulator
VLLVDDHPVIRNIIRLACERSERIAVVGEAADGEGALVQARRLQPDVVVLDLSLPGVSGFEAARRLKRANQGTRIVAISDRRDLRTIVECRAIGVEGYFEKTDGLENVVRAIEAVTDGDRVFTSISRGRQVRGSGAPWVRLREGGK